MELLSMPYKTHPTCTFLIPESAWIPLFLPSPLIWKESDWPPFNLVYCPLGLPEQRTINQVTGNHGTALSPSSGRQKSDKVLAGPWALGNPWGGLLPYCWRWLLVLSTPEPRLLALVCLHARSSLPIRTPVTLNLEKEKATHSSILAWRIPWTV